MYIEFVQELKLQGDQLWSSQYYEICSLEAFWKPTSSKVWSQGAHLEVRGLEQKQVKF